MKSPPGIKKAQLPPGKSLATFDFKVVKQLNRAKGEDLAQNTQGVRFAENVLIFGPSRVGKTPLAGVIGYSLVEKGTQVLFMSTPELVQKLQAAPRDLSLPAAVAKLDAYALIILDDIGYVRKEEAETPVLFELIAHRYEAGSLLVPSNHPFSEWDTLFASNSMTVASIDRLVHHATILEVSAESYRKKQSQK